MIIAGIMTGTSADGLDVALVDMSVSITDSSTLDMRLLAYQEFDFDPDLANDILLLISGAPVPVSLVSSVDARLGQASAEALQQLTYDTGVRCELAVFHGQTIRHDVIAGKVMSTLQVGQPAWIAQCCGFPVLSDVRARDVAEGGHGAPLVSTMDQLLLADRNVPTAMLNLGGIANITVVSPHSDTIAYDTGPANALLDIMARRISGNSRGYDWDGSYALQGKVIPALLNQLLSDPYYAQPAPKSTGKELFNAAYLDRHLAQYRASFPQQISVTDMDVIATLTSLTARTVAQECIRQGVVEVIASGGGTRNPALMTALSIELRTAKGTGIPVMSTEETFGLPEAAKESCLMALLGWLSWHGLPGSLPSATGAEETSIAGRLSPGSGPLRLPNPFKDPPKRLNVLI